MKLKNFFAALLLPLNVLLLFLLVFDSRMVVPTWLQVFGRMHPLVLHFPIVLILAYAFLLLVMPASVKKQDGYVIALDALLVAAAVSATVTALMGLLLSREAGYDADALALHKYTGAITSFALFGLYAYNQKLRQHVTISKWLVAASACIVLWAGHLGGDITHGNNFVLAPITPNNIKTPVAFEDAFVYADLVQPIFQSKCYSCHNSSKEKGGLIMDTKEMLLKGGKDGKLWDTTAQDLGLMMKRIHMGEDEKEHMPPTGKPQLSEEEKIILFAWIKQGASFDKKVTDLTPDDTLHAIATKKLHQSADETFEFAAAAEKDVQKLNNNNRVVTPIAIGSPALAVTFYNKPFYNTKQLEELKKVGDNITQLNLDNMPVKDEDLAVIASFKNLRKLNLDFTDITGKTLGELKKLAFLQTISLSGTGVTAAEISALQNMPKLKHLYLWNTKVAAAEAAKFEQQDKNIALFTGYKGDTVMLKLTPPVLQNDQFVITQQPMKLELKTFLRGTVVRYTLDGKDPDSLNSPIYDSSVVLSSEITVKAKSFKPGWIGSDITEQHFFKSTFKADSVNLLTQPDAKYNGKAGKVLIDLDKSDLGFGNGKWVAYREKDFEAELFFNNPVTAQSLTFSSLLNNGGFIFPPEKIMVWGGMQPNNLSLLATITPEQPTKDMTAAKSLALQCSFKPTQLKYIKFTAYNVKSLPQWHAGKGQKAWVFMDEVFVN